MSETSAPSLITFLHRRGETMWITRHDAEQLALATLPARDGLPGVTREVYVPRGFEMRVRGRVHGDALGRIFDRWVREYVAAGWTVGETRAEPQWPVEPWDVPDPLTAPCPF